MDILERLRIFQPLVNVGQNEKEVMRLAAEEIERLRAEIARMAVDGTERINAQAIEKKMAHISLRHLVQTANLLLQNAEGCAVNHYGQDYQLHGEPGWLRDCRLTIKHAQQVLDATS